MSGFSIMNVCLCVCVQVWGGREGGGRKGERMREIIVLCFGSPFSHFFKSSACPKKSCLLSILKLTLHLNTIPSTDCKNPLNGGWFVLIVNLELQNSAKYRK